MSHEFTKNGKVASHGRSDDADELVKQLRERACPAGKSWTGDAPEEDHGHTDCWLHHQSAKEIERLRSLIIEWADASDAWDAYPDADLRDRAAVVALRKAVGR